MVWWLRKLLFEKSHVKQKLDNNALKFGNAVERYGTLWNGVERYGTVGTPVKNP